MIYIIFICFAAPLTLMIPFLRKQSRWLIIFMLLGSAIAVSAAEVNSAIMQMFQLSVLDISLRVAPVTEEIMKAIPVLMFALLSSDDGRKVLPLSMAVGIGFAILENSHYLINNLSNADLLWALLRGISASLMHGICTFLIGCGIVYVKKQKEIFYAGIFGLLTIGITLHAIYNLLLLSCWTVVALWIPIVIYLIAQILLHRNRFYRKRN